MKTIYLFSGLGADYRMFQFLETEGYNAVHINWIEPKKNETIENYAQRLTTQIRTPKPILVGLSFGGIMAIEVAKIIETEKIILIASAKTKKEIPFYYRFVGFFKCHKFLPLQVLKHANFFTSRLFGAKSNFEKKLLKDILRDTDPVFLIWAIDKIVTWQNKKLHPNTKHIHGTHDKILPIRYVKPDVKIIGGGHFITVNKKFSQVLNHFIFSP